jgi:hypothetical protein
LREADRSIQRAKEKRELPFKAARDLNGYTAIKGSGPFFRPADVIRWAVGTFPEFPFNISDAGEGGEQNRATSTADLFTIDAYSGPT